MTQRNPENPFQQNGEELPDYSEESLWPPVQDSWFKDPRKRRNMLRGAVALVVLLLFVPLYRSLKEWRASSLMGKSGEAFALGDSQGGVSLLKQALALAPGSVPIQRAVELYNARAGDSASFEKLIARMKGGEYDNQELLGIAEIASTKDRVDLASEALGLLSRRSAKHDFLRRSLLEASLEARQHGPTEAADFCIHRAGEAPSREDAGYLKIQAALNLLSVRDAPDTARILDLLNGVIAGRSNASIAAWRIMARLLLSPPPGVSLADAVAEADRLASSFPSLPGVKAEDRLLAADLSIKGSPGAKDVLVAKLVKERRLSPRDEQLDLARWLNGRGCQKEVIAMAGTDRPANDTDWLLVVLDAKAGLGQWDDINSMLATPAGAGIQDAVRHLYLARIAMMKGDQAAAEEEWRNVGASLHLEKPEIVAYIAGYEEQIGAYDRAARAYREMADREHTKVSGLVGLIRCQPQDASAKKLIPFYEELVAVLPENQDVACDLAYLRLLAREDVNEAAASAEKLYASQPNTLTRISTVALGRLRTGDAKGALELYRDKAIDWDSAPAPWKAVRVAVLNASGETSDAINLKASIDTRILRPEERELIASSRKDSK
jgi:hypothetical protein